MKKHLPLKSIKDACLHFDVHDIYELDKLYLKHDQAAIKKGSFLPEDPSLVQNRIKDQLLDLDLSRLQKHEVEIVKGILWLWHHHACTVEIWQSKDLAKAKEYCEKALGYMHPEHPNKITQMIYFLLSGEVDRAKKWAKEEVGDVEREYADYLLAEQKRGVLGTKKPPA